MAIVHDTFTDTAGVNLTAHTGEQGATWASHPGYTGTATISDAGRVYNSSTAGAVMYASGSPASADYDVEANIYMRTRPSTSGNLGVMARVSTSVRDYYMLAYNILGGQWRIIKVIDNAHTNLVSYTPSPQPATGSNTHIKLLLRGTTLQGYINGVLRLTITDTAITTAGKAGLYSSGATVPTNTTGPHYSDFIASNFTANTAPEISVLPEITTDGTPQVNEAITVSTGVWSNGTTSFTYQWKRAGNAITGATTNTYTLQTADANQLITCTISATNAYGTGAATSAAITSAPAPTPVNTIAPLVTGATKTGSTLNSTTGTWSNSPTSYAYQWLRNNVMIVGQTSANYTIVEADEGQMLACAVTAANVYGSFVQASNAVGPISTGMGDFQIALNGSWRHKAIALASGGSWATSGVHIPTGQVATLFVRDTTLAHEAAPHGVPTAYDWQDYPVIHAGNNPGGNSYLNPWGQLYTAADGNPQPNAQVEIRELCLWVLNGSGIWNPLYNSTTINGALYPENFQGSSSSATIDRSITGSVISKPETGYTFHFYPGVSRRTIDPDDIEGIVVTCRGRLHAPSLDSQLAAPELLLGVGADYWPSPTSGPAQDAGIGRLKRVEEQWQTFSLATVGMGTLTAYPLVLAINQTEYEASL